MDKDGCEELEELDLRKVAFQRGLKFLAIKVGDGREFRFGENEMKEYVTADSVKYYAFEFGKGRRE